MNNQPNFEEYSYEALLGVYGNIDEYEYPDRKALVEKLISERKDTDEARVFLKKQTQKSGPIIPLPILTIFLEALSLPHKYCRELFKTGLPIIVIGGLFITINYFLGGVQESSVQGGVYILLSLAFICALVMAIVGCHRIFLLNESDIGEPALLNWTGNEVKYVGWWMLIALCVSLIAFPLMGVFIPILESLIGPVIENKSIFLIVLSLVNFPVYYLASRWSLVLPAAAIDVHGKNLNWSWGLSSGNGWRLTVLISVLPIVADTIFSLLPMYDSVLYNIFKCFLWLVIGVIEIGLLSLSYNFLATHEPMLQGLSENPKEQ